LLFSRHWLNIAFKFPSAFFSWIPRLVTAALQASWLLVLDTCSFCSRPIALKFKIFSFSLYHFPSKVLLQFLKARVLGQKWDGKGFELIIPYLSQCLFYGLLVLKLRGTYYALVLDQWPDQSILCMGASWSLEKCSPLAREYQLHSLLICCFGWTHKGLVPKGSCTSKVVCSKFSSSLSKWQRLWEQGFFLSFWMGSPATMHLHLSAPLFLHVAQLFQALSITKLGLVLWICSILQTV
jgi:hypothetical protein